MRETATELKVSPQARHAIKHVTVSTKRRNGQPQVFFDFQNDKIEEFKLSSQKKE